MTIAPTERLTEHRLLAELERLPAQQAAAVRVLYVADDPRSSAPDLARAVSVDPVLTAQVMRLANSAFYGLSGRVRSSDFAVTVLGFATVRSLAAAHAAGALGEDAVVPDDFWAHAAASAAGAAQASARLGVPRPEGFSLGLLHDLGAAVLCRLDPAGFREIEQRASAPDSRQAALFEKRAFGMDHAAVGGTVLATWRFPAELADAIATHHEPLTSTSGKWQRCLAAGHALAVLSRFPDDRRADANELLPKLEGDLRMGDIDPFTAFDLSRSVRSEAQAIAASFT
ncbi:MAG TPA: HDOD domain-containing protein [Acidimicrobiales bacterium]|nr:HDOD domain-containing protein [Acidimicrobiales bacterium]